MIETIKKYIQDDKIISVAQELTDVFEKDEKKAKKFSLELGKIKAKNFGNIETFDLSFDKGITFVSGDTGSGKSWCMESPLYALSGDSRDKKFVVGKNDKHASIGLWFNKKYQIQWSCTEGSRKVDLKLKNEEGEFSLSKSITDIGYSLLNIIGLQPDLLTATMYYSPRISFQFSRKMPFEIEELIIRIANLDIWLKLESLAKKVKKEEYDNLNILKGSIGVLSESTETDEDIKNQISFLKKQLKEINVDIVDYSMPDSTALNNQYNKLRSQVEERNGVASEINVALESEKHKQELEKKIAALEKDLLANNYSEQDIENVKKKKAEIDKQRDEIKEQGMNLRVKIDTHKEMVANDKCPVLKEDCDRLKIKMDEISKNITNWTEEKKNLLDKFSVLSGQSEKLDAEMETLNQKKSTHDKINFDIDCTNSLIKNCPKVNIEKLKEKLVKFSKTLDKDFEKVQSELENINKTIKEKQSGQTEILDKKASTVSKMETLEKQLQERKKLSSLIKEQKKLEDRQDILDVLIKSFGKKEIPKKESVSTIKKINKTLNSVIGVLSKDTLKIDLSENLDMTVTKIKEDLTLSPKTVSEGEEHVINMAFVLALGMLVSKDAIPYFWADDVCAFQKDDRAKEIIEGLISLQKSGKIGQLFLSSNRIDDLNISNMADRIIKWDAGKCVIVDKK